MTTTAPSSASANLNVPVGRLGALRLELGSVLAVTALAGLVFVPVLGTKSALLFLAAGCALLAMDPMRGIAAGLRAWPLLCLVLYCILSFTWSREPALSFRFGLQLGATLAVALAITDRLGPRDFCLALGSLLGITMVASLAFGGTSGGSAAWTGIFGSKNAFAGTAATFVIFCFGIALTSGVGPVVRLGTFGAGLFGVALVVLAQSIGALVMLAATLSVTGGLLFLPRLGRLGGIVAAGLALLAVAFAALLASAYIGEISGWLLDTTGKDLTLTGRTELWASARDLIAERPLLGVGYQAFWVKGNAEAEALWLMFGIDSRGGFNFHNMYLSNAVEIGLLGVALQAALLFGATIMTAIWTLRTGAAVPAVFFALTFSTVLGSAIEVPLYFQFALKTVLVFAAFAYAGAAIARGR